LTEIAHLKPGQTFSKGASVNGTVGLNVQHGNSYDVTRLADEHGQPRYRVTAETSWGGGLKLGVGLDGGGGGDESSPLGFSGGPSTSWKRRDEYTFVGPSALKGTQDAYQHLSGGASADPTLRQHLTAVDVSSDATLSGAAGLGVASWGAGGKALDGYRVEKNPDGSLSLISKQGYGAGHGGGASVPWIISNAASADVRFDTQAIYRHAIKPDEKTIDDVVNRLSHSSSARTDLLPRNGTLEKVVLQGNSAWKVPTGGETLSVTKEFFRPQAVNDALEEMGKVATSGHVGGRALQDYLAQQSFTVQQADVRGFDSGWGGSGTVGVTVGIGGAAHSTVTTPKAPTGQGR